jgi:hypothetical protein
MLTCKDWIWKINWTVKYLLIITNNLKLKNIKMNFYNQTSGNCETFMKKNSKKRKFEEISNNEQNAFNVDHYSLLA